MADVIASIALVCVLAAYARVWVWMRRRQQEQWAIGEAVRPQVDAIRRRYAGEPGKRDEMNREILAVYEARTTLAAALIPLAVQILFLVAIYSLIVFILQ